jgi:hypothetical protein
MGPRDTIAEGRWHCSTTAASTDFLELNGGAVDNWAPGLNAWTARRVVLVDLVMAAVLAGASITPDISKDNTSAWWLLPGVACFAALAWRRRHPVPAAAIAAVALVLVAGQVMRQIAATGRQAIGEMHRTVTALRTDAKEDARYPVPGLADLDDLLAQVRAAGLPVRFTVQGRARSLSPGAQLAAYRIVQEALTNVRKHATGATGTAVTLCYDAGGIEIEVSDDGHPSGGSRGGGHGITGMRERAIAYGGTITAGPCPGGGWLIRARLAGETDDSDHDPDRR